jgi:hypothetical protein
MAIHTIPCFHCRLVEIIRPSNLAKAELNPVPILQHDGGLHAWIWQSKLANLMLCELYT